MFKDTLREVMTEIEKAAIFEGLKEVRRLEITSRAASTVLRSEDENEKERMHAGLYAGTLGLSTSSFGNAITGHTGVKAGGTY